VPLKYDMPRAGRIISKMKKLQNILLQTYNFRLICLITVWL